MEETSPCYVRPRCLFTEEPLMRGHEPARVIFSVDTAGQNPAHRLTLQQLFQRYQIPATWALADLQGEQTARLAADAAMGAEIALLGDRSWISRESGRTRFARQLMRHLDTAAELDIRISTLALRDTRLDDHLDLLVKHKINVVRGPAAIGDDSQSQLRPLSLRYGIWRAPAAIMIPAVGGWLPFRLAPARRAVRRAMSDASMAHFCIDVEQINQDAARQLSSIERTLKYVAQRRDQGLIQVLTLRQMASQLLPIRTAPMARSILRAA